MKQWAEVKAGLELSCPKCIEAKKIPGYRRPATCADCMGVELDETAQSVIRIVNQYGPSIVKQSTFGYPPGTDLEALKVVADIEGVDDFGSFSQLVRSLIDGFRVAREDLDKQEKSDE